MEVAVRSFVGDVSRFLDASLSPGGWSSSCEARCRWQLQQLRSQLQQLLLHYPSLNPSPADGVTDDVTYDDTGTAELEYCDAGGSGEAVQEAYYDDTGGPGDAEEVYEQPGEAPQEEYDELGAVTGHGGAGVTQELTYDDTAPTTEPYLPMGGKAARMLGLTEGGPAAPAASGAPSVPLVDPEVISIQSQTSQDSGQADQIPAAELSSTARRWGRLQLRQEVKLWSAIYRPYWAGLANGRLYLYKRETDPAQKRAICLSGYEVRPPPPGADVNAKKRPSCFELVKPGGKTHQLLALTPKDARQWMAALEAEGVIAGKCEKEATEETPQRPPLPPPGGDLTLAAAAATAATAAAVPMERPAVAPPIEEDLYYEPEQSPLPQEEVEEEDIYEDISWSGVGRPRVPSAGQAPGSPVDDDEIYDTVGSPPPEPSWPAPVLAAAGRPTLGRTGALPALPPQALPTEPQSPTPPPLPDRAPLAPPSQPSQPPGQPPPPPQRGPRGLTVSADPPPAAIPVRPPPPPQRSRGPAEPPTAPSAAVTPTAAQPPALDARIPSPPSDLLEEIYDELGDGSGQTALPPPSDPFYNVLEPEYLAPSPVPVKVHEDAPDEGYGNSSGGSEADGHAQGEESHYKTLPRQLRPFVAPGTAAKPASPATSATENGSIPAPPAAPERPTQLPTANRRPRAATAGAGSVADVIRKLNRQSVDEEPTPAPARPSARAPAPISADLARKQALIAGGVRALSPPGGASSGKGTANNNSSSSSSSSGSGKPKPTVLPPKPTAAAGRPKPKPAPPARQEARTASPGRKGGGESKPAAGLVPNKSGVYKTLKRMSDSERQPAGSLSRKTDGGSSVPTSPEEDDVYAEIDDDSWRT